MAVGLSLSSAARAGPRQKPLRTGAAVHRAGAAARYGRDRLLLQLARPASRRKKRARKPEKASDRIRKLIEGWPLTPAYVHGRYMDVLAVNGLATSLSLRSDRFRTLWARPVKR